MKKFLGIGSILILALSCSAQRGLETQGLHLLEMEHGGILRSCLVHAPKDRPAAPAPLLLVLHGGGGTAKGIVKLTRQRFNELSDINGFYAAYPSGIGKSWNDFRDDSKTLYRIEGGGHTWPGGWHYTLSRFIGYTSRDINACDEIWNFLKLRSSGGMMQIIQFRMRSM